MRILNFIALSLAFLSFCSCSSDDQPVVTTPVTTPSVFHIEIAGEAHDYSEPKVDKIENTFLIKAGGTQLSFDGQGRFGFVKLNLNSSTPTQTSLFYSFRDFSSHYFNFTSQSIDLVNKRIKGTFSGYLFSNATNLSSEQKYITGYFDLPYIEAVPSISKLGNQAKINGADWSSTNRYRTRGVAENYANVVEHDVSDDPYKIMVHYNQNASPVGTYNFTDANATNKVQLARFDPQTGNYVNYICSGTLNITFRQSDIFEGNYHFTAVNPSNPSETIAVDNGKFRLVYVNF